MARRDRLVDKAWKRLMWCVVLGWATSQAVVLMIVVGGAFGLLRGGAYWYEKVPSRQAVQLNVYNYTGLVIASVSGPVDANYYMPPEVIPGEPPRWIIDMANRLDTEREWSRASTRIGWPMRSNTFEEISNAERSRRYLAAAGARPQSRLEAWRASDIWVQDSALHIVFSGKRLPLLGHFNMRRSTIPLRPVWAGLAVNTAFYGVL